MEQTFAFLLSDDGGRTFSQHATGLSQQDVQKQFDQIKADHGDVFIWRGPDGKSRSIEVRTKDTTPTGRVWRWVPEDE